MKLTPATWPWLLRHELRLAWRNMGAKSIWFIAIAGGFVWVCIHVAAWALLRGLDVASGAGFNLPPMATLIFGGITWLIMSFMLSQAIMLSVTALFDRGDFDLLLTSPMSARTVFIVRGLGVAITSVLIYLLLFSPFAHVGLFMGHANLLAIYPAIISLGLLVSSLGMLLTLTLVRTLGARRARVTAQIIGALTGAFLFLMSQIQNMLSRETRAALSTIFKNGIAPEGPLAPDSAIWFPFRAMLGEPLPLLAIVVMGAGFFLLVVNLTYKRFLAGTQESITGAATKKPAPLQSVAGQLKFRAGLAANVLAKEWKLIARDPNLVTQTLLQTLYLLPMLFLVFRRADMTLLAVPSVVMLAGSLAGSLAWITIAAEDAPELVGVAPVSLTRVRWLKALAAVIPIWILVSPILFYLLFTRPLYALVFAVCVAGSTFSACLTQIWYPRQGDRKNMKKRGQGNVLIYFLEAFSAMGWSAMAYTLLAAPLFTPIGLVAACVGPAAAWMMGKSLRDQGVLA